MRLSTLYKKTSNGKIEQWSIWVVELNSSAYDIVTEHGLVGGKLQQARETVREGKNLGKANETTAREQAEFQARSEWNTKLTRKGYTDSLEKAEAGENAGAGGIRPMLAQPFSKHGDKIEFPCYAQPKLDGIRCIAVVGPESRAVTLWSREQKPIVAVPHIAEAVAELCLPPGTVLDGELYNHDLRSDFEKIVSAVRKADVVDEETAKLIQYHVYDIPRTPDFGSLGFDDRHDHLVVKVLNDPDGPVLVRVHTIHINDKDELLSYFESCRRNGYEGCMARSAGAEYEEGKRSYHLQKLKEFEDAEFPIVGVEEGVGKMTGLAIFVCKAGDQEFRCKMEGSLDGLRKYLKDDSTWRGKKLTVKYQGLTGKAKVPRFPVGKMVRDYE